MKFVSVVQHTQSEWLGAIEDHLEGRGIRFGYFRPFTPGGALPDFRTLGDGLILLGGGPWGAVASERRLPTLDAEVRLARTCLMTGKPVLGFGLGAAILSLAADGDATAAPLRFAVETHRRVLPGALGGLLPEVFDACVYMRDRPVPPAYASILAVDPAGAPSAFQIGANVFGFTAHPGVRPAMIEDLVMEFDDSPPRTAEGLADLARAQPQIEDALVPLMAALVAATGWM